MAMSMMRIIKADAMLYQAAPSTFDYNQSTDFDSHSQSVEPPLRSGKPPALVPASPMINRESSPIRLGVVAAMPGTSEKSTSMNLKIMSFVTNGWSKPTWGELKRAMIER